MSSLSARLLISVSVLLVFFFGVTIVVLDTAFRSAGEQAQRDILDGHLMAILAAAEATDGVRVRSLDGNWSYDVSGSYGVNLLGYDFYKQCIRRGVERVDELVDRALVRQDHVRHRGEVGVEQAEDLVGGETLGQGSETAQVRHQEGHLSVLPAERRTLR